MRRGILTGKACSSCRKKKRKCDGLTPCSNCRARQDQCTYSPTRWTSKDGLRSEILEFKKREATAETVIDALRSPTRGAPVLEQLQRGESLEQIENKLLGGRASSSTSAARWAYSEFGDLDAEGEYEDGRDGDRDDSEMRSPSPFSRAGSVSAAFPAAQARASIPSNRSSSSSSIAAPPAGGAQFFPRHWGEIHLSHGSAASSPLASASPSVPSPPQLQPPHPHHPHIGGGFDASKRQPTTFSLAMMEQLLDLLFAWECPPLTMITREAFTADFVIGRQGKYCSWPLICAIVAVTSRLQENPAAVDALKTPTNDFGASTRSTPILDSAAGGSGAATSTAASPGPGATAADPYPGGYELPGKLYFEQGYKLLAEQRQCKSLADVQALGLLSLREACNGNEASARVLAQRCLRDISSLRERTKVEDGTFLAASAETYAGAICLTSMLDLVTYSQPGASRSLAWHTSSQFERGDSLSTSMGPSQGGPDQQHTKLGHQQPMAALHPGLSTSGGGGARAASPGGYQTPVAPGRVASGKRVATFSDAVVQITTLACSRMNMMGPGNDSSFVLDIYEKCLEWYNSALALVHVGSGWTTFNLFLHMFYHFSLGVLFRPLLDQPSLVFRNGTISPRVICAESAQAVLGLAQSYAAIFSLRRPPTFVPYFVYAAGLLQMELANGSSMPNRGQSQQGHHQYQQTPHGQQQYALRLHPLHQQQQQQQQQQQGQPQFQQTQEMDQHRPQLVRQGPDMVSGQMGTLKLGSSMAQSAQGVAEERVLQYLSEMAQTHPAAAEALLDLRKRLLGG
ncbi:hypothetical protein RB597_009378 [Gaeumannomyces tritici]